VIAVIGQVTALLKRGALVTAANWEAVVVQFIAESAFKALLLVPIVGAAFLLALLVGGALHELFTWDVREIVGLVVGALSAHPLALAAYLTGVAIIIVGGSILMFAVKAGTVAVLVAAERQAPTLEQPPLRTAVVRRAGHFTWERFLAGSDRHAPPFIGLGLLLLGTYVVAGAAYLGAVAGSYRTIVGAGPGLGATLVAAAASVWFVATLTAVHLFYLLAQIAIVAGDCSVGPALRAVGTLLRREIRLVAGVFGAVLALVVLATVASVLATALLGFVGFVPVIGIAVLPLQLLAWLGRGLLFQFIGLTTLTACACLARGGAEKLRLDAAPQRRVPTPPRAAERTA